MTAGFVVTSDAAESDIEDIARFVSADSIISAKKFALEFNVALNRIRAFPQSGHAVRGKPKIYVMRVSARFRRYLIVYRLDEGGVEILRVLHSAMDLRARFAGL